MRNRVVAAILAAEPGHDAARLRALAQQICATSCERIAIVLGAAPASIGAAVEGLPVALLPNVLWSEGRSASVRCAVAWALRSGADGLLLAHGDHAAGGAHLDQLLRAFRTSRATVASSVGGERALPAVFGVEVFARLGQLTGDRDAREVLRLLPEVTSVPSADATAIPTLIPESERSTGRAYHT